MNLRSRKVFIVWLTTVCYVLAGLGFPSNGLCCSGHTDLDGQVHDGHDNPTSECVSTDGALSKFATSINECLLSHPDCCGQGLRGGSERVPRHMVRYQGLTEPDRIATYLLLTDDQRCRKGIPVVRNGRTSRQTDRAYTRDPVFESILTVSLLI